LELGEGIEPYINTDHNRETSPEEPSKSGLMLNFSISHRNIL